MALNPIVKVDIAINAVNLTQAGFGTPLFITAHQNADERVLDINSADDLLDLGFESTDPAYKADVQVFSNSPSPSVMKIGRRGATSVVATSQPDITNGIGDTYSITVAAAGLSDTTTITQDDGSTYPDVFSVLTAMKNEIEATFVNVLDFTINGTGNSATLSIKVAEQDASGQDWNNNIAFQVTGEATAAGSATPTVTVSTSGTEAAADALKQITEEDGDYYFLTSEARPETDAAFVEALADEAVSRGKIYFVASADEDVWNGTGDASNNLFHKFNDGQNTRAVTMWHQDATNDYPELKYVGYNAPYDAGSVTWANLRLPNLEPSKQSNGKPLNPTQLGNLAAINCNFIVKDAGVNITRTGITAGGEWIDVIRGVDWLTEDMTVSLKSLLFNQQGGKVPYTDGGIARVRETCQSSLQRAVNRGFLSSYELTVPLIGEVNPLDFVARVLKDVKFTGILAGAIHSVEVRGQVTVPYAA